MAATGSHVLGRPDSLSAQTEYAMHWPDSGDTQILHVSPALADQLLAQAMQLHDRDRPDSPSIYSERTGHYRGYAYTAYGRKSQARIKTTHTPVSQSPVAGRHHGLCAHSA